MYNFLGVLLLFVAAANAELQCIKHPDMTQNQMMEFLEELVDYPIPGESKINSMK